MKIRIAEVKNFDKLIEIRKEFFRWEAERDKRVDPNYEKRSLSIRTGKNLRQDNVAFFIAEEKGQIVGFAGASIDKAAKWTKLEKEGHLFNLYVKEDYRRKGIGKKLIKRTMEWFKKNKISDVKILVYNFNEKAHKIYKKYNFKDYVIEMRKN